MLINMLCLDAIGPCSTLLTIARRQGFFRDEESTFGLFG